MSISCVNMFKPAEGSARRTTSGTVRMLRVGMEGMKRLDQLIRLEAARRLPRLKYEPVRALQFHPRRKRFFCSVDQETLVVNLNKE